MPTTWLHTFLLQLVLLACASSVHADAAGVIECAVASVDLLAGAPTADSNRGAVVVMLMQGDGLHVKDTKTISRTSGGFIEAGGELSDVTNSGLGASLAGVQGQWSDDGTTTVIASCLNDDTVWVMWLTEEAVVDRLHKLSDGSPNGMPAGSVGTDANSFGHGLAEVPPSTDIDGDSSTGEILVGSYSDDDGGPDRGAAYVVIVQKSTAYYVDHLKVSQTSGSGWTPVGPNDGSKCGHGLAMASGIAGGTAGSVVMSCFSDDDGGSNVGSLYVLQLAAEGTDITVASSTKLSATRGGLAAALAADGQQPLANDYQWGFGVASLGDVDGDGHLREIVAGSEPGHVDLVFLAADGTVRAVKRLRKDGGRLPPSNVGADVSASARWGGSAKGVLRPWASRGTHTGADAEFEQPWFTLAVGAVEDGSAGTNTGAVFMLRVHVTVPPAAPTLVRVNATQSGDGELLTAHAVDVATGFNIVGARPASLNHDDEPPVLVSVDPAFVEHSGDTQNGGAGTLSNVLAASTRFGSWGTGVGSLGDIDSDGVSDIIVGVHTDNDGGTNRGAAYTLLLNEDGSVKDQEKISDTHGGFTGVLHNDGLFGYAAIGFGGDDWNGDGVPDAAVSAPQDKDPCTKSDRCGAFFILFLTSRGDVAGSHKINEGGTGALPAETLPGDTRFGNALAYVPSGSDIDGDLSTAEMFVGARGFNNGGEDKGAVMYIVLNKANAHYVRHQWISQDYGGGNVFVNPINNQEFGYTCAVLGDLGGGETSVAVGTPFDVQGAVYVVSFNSSQMDVVWSQKLGAHDGGVTAARAAAGAPAWHYDWNSWGASMANLGDLDGDGRDELGVGSWTKYIDILFLDAAAMATAVIHLGESTMPDTVLGGVPSGTQWAGSIAVARRLTSGSLILAVASTTADNGGLTDSGALYMLRLHVHPHSTALRAAEVPTVALSDSVVAMSVVCDDGCALGCAAAGPSGCLARVCSAGYKLTADGHGACCPASPADANRGAFFRPMPGCGHWECGFCTPDCLECTGPTRAECLVCADVPVPSRMVVTAD